MLAGLLYFTPSLNWGYRTTLQAGLNHRSISWPRGRVMGGSTAINGLMYIRGDRADYDGWCENGLSGWGYEDVLPYFRAFERNITHSDTRFHGHEGELWTCRAEGLHPLYDAWRASAHNAGFQENSDFNGACQEGIGLFDFNIRRGRRVSAADAFIHPVRARSNLSVRMGAEALKLHFDGLRCIGVETATGLVRARREVIVAAGTINSPKLLEISGIGDASILSGIGIDVVSNRSEVGSNLQDHVGITVQHSATKPVTLYGMMRPDRAIIAVLRDLLTGGGPAASVPLEAGGFLRTRATLARPDVHVIFVPGLSLAATPLGQQRHGFMTSVYQLRPKSRGSTHISSNNISGAPKINPDYLTANSDREVLRDAVRLARHIMRQTPLESYRGLELSPGAAIVTDDEIDAWVRATATTVFHPVGTCRMGADTASVVDSELRVRGVDALRVVDASVMPSIVSGNTSAPTMMIAEKGAEAILRAAR